MNCVLPLAGVLFGVQAAEQLGVALAMVVWTVVVIVVIAVMVVLLVVVVMAVLSGPV